MQTNKIFKLIGKVQNYAWGGKNYIPNLLSLPNIDNKPCAEYWMGAHPSAPSTIFNKVESTGTLLNQFIANDANEVLTPNINLKFAELPYLYKILDVNEMLSIQVHPSKIEAEKGFEFENKMGIALNAFNRNYKDKNHKPEIMIALGDFWLLHGFKQLHEIELVLNSTKEFANIATIFKENGLKAMYKFVMEMPQIEIDTMLLPLITKEIAAFYRGALTKKDAGWWVAKFYKNAHIEKDIDRGIFSIYIFNIVNATKGQAVFQAAGVPHAYLEGQNVELMANSDNVLRGGLTPKYVDVAQLLQHTLFEPVVPNVMLGNAINEFETSYNCPVDDFEITKINIEKNKEYITIANTPQIVIVIEGTVVFSNNNNSLEINSGEACFILPNTNYTILANKTAEMYKAFV
jgi:mannose-6-phosphate isomerase